MTGLATFLGLSSQRVFPLLVAALVETFSMFLRSRSLHIEQTLTTSNGGELHCAATERCRASWDAASNKRENKFTSVQEQA